RSRLPPASSSNIDGVVPLFDRSPSTLSSQLAARALDNDATPATTTIRLRSVRVPIVIPSEQEDRRRILGMQRDEDASDVSHECPTAGRGMRPTTHAPCA